MSTRPLIVGKIALQGPTQRSLVPHHNVVQALASDGAHQPFRKGILPGGSRRSKHFLHAHISGYGDEVFSVDGISIAQHIARRLVPWKRFPHLLHGPLLCRMFRHPESSLRLEGTDWSMCILSSITTSGGGSLTHRFQPAFPISS